MNDNAARKTFWRPSEASMHQSRMHRLTTKIHRRGLIEEPSYRALHRWSVERPEDFNRELWDWLDVKVSRPPERFFEWNGDDFRRAKFFPGARLNYAENLLENDASRTAIVAVKEDGSVRTATFGELKALVVALAKGLSQAGVKKGDGVAGVLPFCLESVAAMLATSAVGAVWSSCSPDFGVQGLHERLSLTRPKILVTPDGSFYGGKRFPLDGKIESLLELMEEQPLWLRFPFLGETLRPKTGSENWSDFLVENDDPFRFVQADFDHPLFAMFSSGTTGKPKGIVHGQGGTLVAHKKEHLFHGDLQPGDRLCFFTTCGWMMMNWTVSALSCGVSLVIYDGSPAYPEPTRLWEIVAEHRVNHLGTSPKYLQSCMGSEDAVARLDLDCLKTAYPTGSPSTQAHFRWFYEHVKRDARLASISGGTDLIGCFMAGNPLTAIRGGELQTPVLGMDVAAFDDRGEPVWNRKGELVCRQPFPNMPVGFLEDPDGEKYRRAYFDVFPGVWAHGDYVEFDPATQGSVIHGRCDATLNPGGVRIGAAEIYGALDGMPEIEDSLACGLRENDGESVVLFVQPKKATAWNEALIAKIKASIRQSTSPRHVPAKILPVSQVPVTVSGKKMELAVKRKIHGEPVPNLLACANPESLEDYPVLV